LREALDLTTEPCDFGRAPGAEVIGHAG